MVFKFDVMSFGKKRDRISVLHLRKPNKNGLAGMVYGKSIPHQIAIVVDDTTDRDYDFACLSWGVGTDHYFIKMDREIFYGIKRNNKMARTTLFHELGHYYYNHTVNDSAKYEGDRINEIKRGNVLQMELEADAFAAKYLGKEYVADGLRLLKDRSIVEYNSAAFDDYDNDEGYLQLAIEELNNRIEHILSTVSPSPDHIV